jgi:COMPASS component SWD3
LNAHIDYVTAVHFNRDGSLIVSCSLDGLMCVHRNKHITLAFHHHHPHIHNSPLAAVYGVYHPDNASRLSRKGIVPFGTKIRQLLMNLQRIIKAKTYPHSQHVQFSPNSKYILSTAHDSAIRLWDFQTSRCLKTYVGHQNAKYCIGACFSVTGGKWIVSGSEDNKIYLWDLQTREVMQVLDGHQG